MGKINPSIIHGYWAQGSICPKCGFRVQQGGILQSFLRSFSQIPEISHCPTCNLQLIKKPVFILWNKESIAYHLIFIVLLIVSFQGTDVATARDWPPLAYFALCALSVRLAASSISDRISVISDAIEPETLDEDRLRFSWDRFRQQFLYAGIGAVIAILIGLSVSS